MNDLEKLLERMPTKDRRRVLAIMTGLMEGKLATLRIEKLKNSSFYRIRTGRYRIIFSLNRHTKFIKIEDLRLRNEATYK
ncbi:hypothetical protein HYV73_02740 [Candidatus Uhrbacteria bacterium]|nr:hypothetical protein [Candidatus Uhrbacteria bacterium]